MTLADQLTFAISVVQQPGADMSAIHALLVDVRRMERRLDEQMRDAQEDADAAERAARLRAAGVVQLATYRRPSLVRPVGPGSVA